MSQQKDSNESLLDLKQLFSWLKQVSPLLPLDLKQFFTWLKQVSPLLPSLALRALINLDEILIPKFITSRIKMQKIVAVAIFALFVLIYMAYYAGENPVDNDPTELSTIGGVDDAVVTALQTVVIGFGFRCDSVDIALPLFGSRKGYELICNDHRYTYNIVDLGGHWQVVVK